MKRILSLVLVAMMVIGVMPMAFAADTAATDSAYAEALGFLSAEQIGVYQGQEYGLAADEGVTRAQMAMFTARFITGITDDEEWATSVNDSGFADVEDFDGYSDAMLGAISFASQKGIVNGVSATEFDPEDGVEYREAITMIVRALGFTYKASGYPWNYYTKANELGILDGITGVDMTEEINRGVVAQLLYNALFAEIDGQSVAAKVFDVDYNVVIITATNDVVLGKEDAKVLRTGAVAFKTLDAQGEPKGAAYHVPYTQFGLKNQTEANAAVGYVYLVYTTGSMSNIVRCVSLTDVYENRGYVTGRPVSGTAITGSADANVTGGKTKGYYMTIGGTQYQFVTKFNELNADTTPNGDKMGSQQIKLYTLQGSKNYSLNNEYLLSDGIVYKVNGTKLEVYAQYSSFLDAYYTLANGKWEIVDIDGLLFKENSTNAGYLAVQPGDDTINLNAYADYIASDIDLDTYYDRVIWRNYTFGTAIVTKEAGTDDTNLETYLQFAYDKNNNNKFDDKDAKGVLTDGRTGKFLIDGDDASEKNLYRFTGVAASAIANGAYVLFYVDETQNEIDVLEVIGAKENDADHNYVAKGYVRNFNVNKNTITIDGQTLTYGHNNLYRSPLKQPNATELANQNGTYTTNYNAIAPFYNQYVTYVVVDNRVVRIAAAGAQTDYVIIDQIVGIEADGIVVNGYSTIAGGYDEFKIKSYNGWALGGDFDFSLFYQLGLWGNTSTYNVWDLIPLTNKVYYKVVTEKDGAYDLTDTTEADVLARNVTLTVNAYGYIVGTDGANGFSSTKYTSVSDKDYWLFLETGNTNADNKVYDFNGKINQATFTGLKALKASGNDYVFVAGSGFGFDEGVFGSDIKYMMYKSFIPEIGNANLWQVSPFEYTILMTNVVTGAPEQVIVSADFIKDQSKFDNPVLGGGFGGVGYVSDLFKEGEIYRIVDGAVTSSQTYTLADAAALQGGKADTLKYEIGKTYLFTANTSLKTLIATEAVRLLFNGMETTGLVSSYASKVTVFDGRNKDLKKNNNFVLESDVTYTVHYVINKDGTATAWVAASQDPDYVKRGTLAYASRVNIQGSLVTPATVNWCYNGRTKTLKIDADNFASGMRAALSGKYAVTKVGFGENINSSDTTGFLTVANNAYLLHSSQYLKGFSVTFENVATMPVAGDKVCMNMVGLDKSANPNTSAWEVTWVVPTTAADVVKVNGVVYPDLASAVAAATAGSTVKLLNDATVASTLVIDKAITLDLNGKSITMDAAATDPCAIRVLADTVVKNGTVDGGANYAFIVGNTTTSANLTIEDGTTVKGTVSAVSVTLGKLTVNGGDFSVADSQWGATYLLNCIDANYTAGTAVIEVKGGTFKGFNPGANAAEGANTNFCATGLTGKDDGTGVFSIVDASTVTPPTPPATTVVTGTGTYYNKSGALGGANMNTIKCTAWTYDPTAKTLKATFTGPNGVASYVRAGGVDYYGTLEVAFCPGAEYSAKTIENATFTNVANEDRVLERTYYVTSFEVTLTGVDVAPVAGDYFLVRLNNLDKTTGAEKTANTTAFVSVD